MTTGAVQEALKKIGFRKIRGYSGRRGVALGYLMSPSIVLEIALGASESAFSCTVRLLYFPSARANDKKGPIFHVLKMHDLFPSGLEQIGTPGNACWSTSQMGALLNAIEQLRDKEFGKYRETANVIADLMDQVGRAPKVAGNQLSLAFLLAENGHIDAARFHFSAFLELQPNLRAIMHEDIEAALTTESRVDRRGEIFSGLP